MDWGNNGFIKVNYSDFMEYLQAAYQIVLKDLPNEKLRFQVLSILGIVSMYRVSLWAMPLRILTPPKVIMN
jgi:hypothetical protein